MLGVPDEGNQTVCQSVLVCKHGSVCVYQCMNICVCVCMRCVPGGSKQQMFASIQIRADGPGGSLALVGTVV